MKSIGMYMAIFGIGSIVLNQFGYEFSILMWIDNWGTGVGWGIRIGFVVVGAVLFVLGKNEEVEEAEQ